LKDIIIIGGGIAGLSAAIFAKGTDGLARVTVISEENDNPYRRSCLPHIIDGTSKFEDLVMFSGDSLSGINFLKDRKVLEVDISSKNITVKKDGEPKKEVTYDSLIFSTGAKNTFPSIYGIKSKSVCALRTFDEAVRISKAGGNVTVVGAGFISLMITEALQRKGVKVIQVVRSRILRAVVEPEISTYIHKKMMGYRVKIIIGAVPEEIIEKNGKTILRTSKGDIESSTIIFSTGVAPDIELAKNAGIEIGLKGIKTDEKMCTSASDVYAAGDCAEVVDAITKKKTYIPLASVAAKGGKIAGINAAGGKEVTGEFLRMQNEMVFGINIVTIGYTEDSARAFVDSGSKKLNLNGAYVVTDSKDRVIGASCLYTKVSSPYINMLYDSMKKERTFTELKDIIPDSSQKIGELMKKGAEGAV